MLWQNGIIVCVDDFSDEPAAEPIAVKYLTERSEHRGKIEMKVCVCNVDILVFMLTLLLCSSLQACRR